MQAVVWDCDGTLLDTEPLYLQAETEIVEQYGPKPDLAAVTPQLLGTVPEDAARIMIEHFKLPITPKEYIEQRNVIMEKMVTRVPLMPGIRSLVENFAQRGFSQGIATSSSRAMFEKKKVHESEFFDKYFPVTVCGEDVENGKPAPDIFLRAAKLMGRDPSTCVAFEDAPGGVRAAKSAGMLAIAIQNEHATPQMYHDAGADVLVTTWEDITVEQVLALFSKS